MLNRSFASLAVCAWLGLVTSGCPESPPSCPPGSETCACYGNGTCDAELQCLSNLCVALTSVEGDATSPSDAGQDAAGDPDGSAADVSDANGSGDAGAGDAGAGDAGGSDAGAGDAGGSDAGAGDAGGSDAGAGDAGGSDAGAGDAGGSDAGAGDAGAGGDVTDAGTGDAGGGDAGTGDAGGSDAGAGDAGGSDAGAGDAGAGGDVTDAGTGDAEGSDAGAGDAGAGGDVTDAGAGDDVTDAGAGDDGADGDVSDATGTPSPQRVVGYYTSWSIYGRDFHVADLPGDKLTHINYAFVNLNASGDCLLGDPWADTDISIANDSAAPFKGNFYQLVLLKQQHPELKTLLSVGGWTWSDHFSTVASTSAGRQAMAQSCVDLVRTYDFDGLDVDWEYPVAGGEAGNATSPADKANYTLLLQAIRDEFNQYEAGDGKDYLLTIAAPAGSSLIVNFDVPGLVSVLDWINVMAYDLAGSWDPITGHNAPLNAPAAAPNQTLSVHDSIQAYLAAGAPPDQIVLGTPFYGRGFAGVPDTAADGVYMSFSGVPMGTWENAVFDYDDLVDNYLTDTAYDQHWSTEAQVPWLFNPTAGVFITYDDVTSMEAKGSYIKQHGLGGAMIWEMSANRDDALIDALLGAMQ